MLNRNLIAVEGGRENVWHFFMPFHVKTEQCLLSSGASVWVREREKEECSICGVTSKQHEGGRRGSGSTLKFQVERLRGRTKGTCWPRTQVSFIHTRAHTHIRTQDEQQPFNSIRLAFATFDDFWFVLSTFGVNYYFLLFPANKPIFFKVKCFSPSYGHSKTRIHPA